MIKKILEYFKLQRIKMQGVKNTVYFDLEEYIIAHNPTSIYEVDRLEREFNDKNKTLHLGNY